MVSTRIGKRCLSVLTNKHQIGLFGIRSLVSPKDFPRLAQEAITESNSIISLISSKAYTSPSMLLDYMDRVSDIVCSVVDPANLCIMVHPDEEYREQATIAFGQLKGYFDELNTNRTLSDALKEITEDHSIMESLSSEQRRMAKCLLQELEIEGVYLPQEERKKVRDLRASITQLELTYQNNCNSSYGDTVDVPINILQEVVGKEAIGQFKHGRKTNTRSIDIRNTHIGGLLRHSNPRYRLLAFYIMNTKCEDNIPILEEILHQRSRLANILGYKSWAHLVVANRMSQNPETILKFLTDLSDKLNKKASIELEMLLNEKKKVEGNEASNVCAWDKEVYIEKIQADIFDQSLIDDYFTLENSLEGVKFVCRELFGVRMREVEMEFPETWHKDVRKLIVEDDDSIIGVIYLDLIQRPNKFRCFSQFTIKGRHAIHESLNNEYYPGAVAIVCSYSSPAGKGLQTHLTHSEVETFFHEFGHVMHSLLSRSKYHHLSGTRVEHDLVETPSTLFENFVYDHRVLKHFARHYKTNEIISEDIVNSLRKSKYTFQAFNLKRNIVYALMDISFHSVRDTNQTTNDLLEKIQNEHGILPHLKGTFPHSNFIHLIGYASGYYAYPYAEVFSSAIWKKLFLNDPLSRTAGEIFRRKVLEPGASKSPQDILTSVLGSAPLIDEYITSIQK